MMTTIRMMSPTHRRIVELNLASPRDRQTDEQLRLFGWNDYLGPGEADDNGWFIPETDPSVTPPTPSRLGKRPARGA